jgi:division protein CdvB (Snf7/Vps24/ESCRT-III family)
MSILFDEIKEEESNITYESSESSSSSDVESPYRTKLKKKSLNLDDIYDRLKQKPYL